MPPHVFGVPGLWRRDISSAPLAADSEAQAAELVRQVTSRGNGAAYFNVYRYGMSWYTVGPHQPRRDVKFSNCQHKPSTPPGLYGPGGQFEDVPIPDDALPTVGTDSSLSIYQPSTDTLWDFWRAYRDDEGWHACWGGRIDDVSSNQGVFPPPFGTSATGLAYEGGTISIVDALSGHIDHALGLAIPEPARGVTSWPALRSDGISLAPDAIAEGTRLRLDPALDVDAYQLSPLARMVAEAAQTYGFIVTDKSGVVSLRGELPNHVVARTGTDPWVAVLAGDRPSEVFENFPWDHVQALPVDYGKPDR